MLDFGYPEARIENRASACNAIRDLFRNIIMRSRKHGGTSRHKARGGAQHRTRSRKGMGGSGGGSGRRSTKKLRKRPTRTGTKKSSIHAPKQGRGKRLPRRRGR